MNFIKYNEESLKELAMMIISDCRVINYRRTIYLNRLPLVLQMQSDAKNFTLAPPKVKNSSILSSSKLSISSSCSEFDNTIFNIETDDFESGYVNFMIITQYDTNGIKNVIKDIIGIDVGVRIFFYFSRSLCSTFFFLSIWVLT